MAAESSTISIPRDVLEPIIQAHVSAAIIDALGERSRLVESAVAFALTRKVDEKGQVNGQDYYNKTEFLKWLVNDAITKAVTVAVHEAVAADVEKIKAQVAKEIKNQRSPLVKSLIEGIAKGAADSARWSVAVNVSQSR